MVVTRSLGIIMADISKYDLKYVVRTYASFSLSNSDMHPKEITERLNLNPLSIEVKGEWIGLPKGGGYFAEENHWYIRSTSDSLDINIHLSELLDLIEPIANKFETSMGYPEFTITYLNNYLYAGSGPTIESEIVARIGKLNATMSFDIYQVDQDLTEEEKNSKFRRITRNELNNLLNGNKNIE